MEPEYESLSVAINHLSKVNWFKDLQSEDGREEFCAALCVRRVQICLGVVP